ncbi:hypothetical protein C723_2149 [Christiangramia flava JLT2011]|uniref:Uncharacterized protein n=1 Tax=Christiangramia flava JLT2011 TaxID=1229726 RepID=A0A1L7I7Z6_9FLAO|nr:hypothetical protein GRFL_2620 [Christiangramia flava JLT2011]OSS38758.1 hypothetical protein C723_2149 [Christiangramia flava JLT2011]
MKYVSKMRNFRKALDLINDSKMPRLTAISGLSFKENLVP